MLFPNGTSSNPLGSSIQRPSPMSEPNAVSPSGAVHTFKIFPMQSSVLQIDFHCPGSAVILIDFLEPGLFVQAQCGDVEGINAQG